MESPSLMFDEASVLDLAAAVMSERDVELLGRMPLSEFVAKLTELSVGLPNATVGFGTDWDRNIFLEIEP